MTPPWRRNRPIRIPEVKRIGRNLLIVRDKFDLLFVVLSDESAVFVTHPVTKCSD